MAIRRYFLNYVLSKHYYPYFGHILYKKTFPKCLSTSISVYWVTNYDRWTIIINYILEINRIQTRYLENLCNFGVFASLLKTLLFPVRNPSQVSGYIENTGRCEKVEEMLNK
jgi:hypothetical protein